jgi:hypothetical protein
MFTFSRDKLLFCCVVEERIRQVDWKTNARIQLRIREFCAKTSLFSACQEIVFSLGSTFGGNHQVGFVVVEMLRTVSVLCASVF